MSVYASIAHDFSRYARIAEGRIIQVAKASRESRGFLFTDSELDDLCSMEVLFAAFGVFMALPPLPQTNPGHGSVFEFDYEEALRGLSHLLRLAGTLLGTNRLQGPTGTVFEIERNFGKIPPLWGYFSLPLPQRQVR